jgi:feruloyl esterase
MFSATAAAFAETPCERLKSLSLANAAITVAESVPAGPYLPAGLPPDASQQPKIQVPAYCRVSAVLTPSSDSHIEMELWMPATSAWNRKYLAVGGGGWVGSFNFNGMLAALQQGYATSSTDTGHTGFDASFALGHPEKVVDFAYRAIHEMALKSKAIMTAFYGGAPRLSYWYGCSTGGRQGLMEAVRSPEDFDGYCQLEGGISKNEWQIWLVGPVFAVLVPKSGQLSGYEPWIRRSVGIIQGVICKVDNTLRPTVVALGLETAACLYRRLMPFSRSS